MSIQLLAGTRPIELGTVSDIVFTKVSRKAQIEIPGSRGSGREDLGSLSTQFTIIGALSGDERLEDFNQLDRYRMLAEPLKFLNPYRDTVVYVDAVKPREYFSNGLTYEMTLIETRFKSISKCDSLVGWEDVSSGSIALEDTDPQPREGYYCITDTLSLDVELDLIYTPPDTLDLSNYNYIAFHVRLNNVSELDYAPIHLIDYNGFEAYYDFSSIIAEADKWYRLILHKTEFTEDPGFDWSAVKEIIFEVGWNSNGDWILAVDDLGAYE